MAQPVAEYEVYKRIKVLGEGSFGKAYLVECLSDKTLCVIKQVDLSKMNDQEKKDTLNEAKILEAFNHPNIVKFREVYKTKKGKLCIVMDYADGGDLSNKIKEQGHSNFNENIILDWFTQITLALKHVHDRKVLHRDLKCQNIFLTKSNLIKLGDFGIARVLSSTRENAKTMVGTPYYLSPEIINGRPYSFKSDIWSLGVVLYELCALKPPFDASSLTFLAMKIVKGQYNPIPGMYSKDLKNLISVLLQVDPTKRPTTNSILQMPIIQQRVKNFLSETMRIKELSHTVLHNEKFVKNDLKFENIKSVNQEAPMPDYGNKNQYQPKPQPQPVQQKPIYNPQPVINKPNVERPVTRENNVRPVYNEKPKEQVDNNAGKNQAPIQQRYNPSPFLKQEKRDPEDYVKRDQIIQQLLEDKMHGKNNFVPINPQQEARKNMINPQPQQNVNIYKKPAEKEVIVGGGFGGGMININAGNFVQKKSEPKPVPVVKKNAPQPQIGGKKEDADLAQKQLELKKKIAEQERMKRERLLAEERQQKQMAEDKRNEKRKKIEEHQKKMKEDIAAKRRAANKNKDVLFEVVGVRDSSNSENPENISPDLEDLDETPQFAEESLSPDKILRQQSTEVSAPKKDPVKKPVKIEEKPASKQDIKKFIQQKQNEAKQNRKLYTEEAETKAGGVQFEIYVPTKEPPKRVQQQLQQLQQEIQQKAENAKNEEAKAEQSPLLSGENLDNADYGEDYEELKLDEDGNIEYGEDKEDFQDDEEDMAQDDIDFMNEDIEDNKITPNIEKILNKLDNEGEIDKKENEDLIDYNALVLELSHLMETPVDEKPKDTSSEQTSQGQEPTKASTSEEDRIDDPDDDMTTVKSMTFADDQMKTDISMDYISDFGKLESLRISLEDGLGVDNFIKAYRIIKELYEKNPDLNEVEHQYGKTEYYMELFPFLTRELVEQYLPQMFLFCLMEDIAEQDK